jgi:hypothetical protein
MFLVYKAIFKQSHATNLCYFSTYLTHDHFAAPITLQFQSSIRLDICTQPKCSEFKPAILHNLL